MSDNTIQKYRKIGNTNFYFYQFNENKTNYNDKSGIFRGKKEEMDSISLNGEKYYIKKYTTMSDNASGDNGRSILKPSVLLNKTEYDGLPNEITGGSKQNKTKFRKSKNNRKSRKNFH